MNYDKFIDSKNKTMAPCGFEERQDATGHEPVVRGEAKRRLTQMAADFL
jgi:hypothetical protein